MKNVLPLLTACLLLLAGCKKDAADPKPKTYALRLECEAVNTVGPTGPIGLNILVATVANPAGGIGTGINVGQPVRRDLGTFPATDVVILSATAAVTPARWPADARLSCRLLVDGTPQATIILSSATTTVEQNGRVYAEARLDLSKL